MIDEPISNSKLCGTIPGKIIQKNIGGLCGVKCSGMRKILKNYSFKDTISQKKFAVPPTGSNFEPKLSTDSLKHT